jgi:2-polyprenyl-3-methyl-5-hydroxy-6-metoxy-1,4-benzoquinol methylase
MPNIRDNYNMWSSFAWSEAGDEWSAPWGGAVYLWLGSILPRIQAFLPTNTILEIAPGYGRCTQFFVPLCRKIILVDLAENCIEACKKRFENNTHIDYYVNDGKSLDMVADNAVDFVFSWDSLVHADNEALHSYLRFLSTKLKPDGVGFIHHSNLGSFVDSETGQLTIENPHWRDSTMTATLFRKYCGEVGLKCLSQEIIVWANDALTDCFSLFTRELVKTNRATNVYENNDFMYEARKIRKISEIYKQASLKMNI